MLNIYFFSLLHIFIFIILKMKNKRGAINLLNSMSIIQKENGMIILFI